MLPRVLLLCLHGFSGPLSRVYHYGTLFPGSLLHGHDILICRPEGTGVEVTLGLQKGLLD